MIRWGVDFASATAANGSTARSRRRAGTPSWRRSPRPPATRSPPSPLPDGGGSTDSSGDISGLMTDTGPRRSRVVITYASALATGSVRRRPRRVRSRWAALWSVRRPAHAAGASCGSLRIDTATCWRSRWARRLRPACTCEFGHVMGPRPTTTTPVQVIRTVLQIPGAPTAYADGDHNGLFALASQSLLRRGGFGARRSASLS